MAGPLHLSSVILPRRLTPAGPEVQACGIHWRRGAFANLCRVWTLSPRVWRAGMRQLEPEYRLEKNIKIAMLYLEDDDAVSAEAFIKKASALIGACKVGAVRGRKTWCRARDRPLNSVRIASYSRKPPHTW